MIEVKSRNEICDHHAPPVRSCFRSRRDATEWPAIGGSIFITDSMWASTRPRLVRSWRSAVRCACRAARNRWMRKKKKKKKRKREKGRACTCRDAVVQGRTRPPKKLEAEERPRQDSRVSHLKRRRRRRSPSKSSSISIHPFDRDGETSSYS